MIKKTMCHIWTPLLFSTGTGPDIVESIDSYINIIFFDLDLCFERTHWVRFADPVRFSVACKPAYKPFAPPIMPPKK